LDTTKPHSARVGCEAPRTGWRFQVTSDNGVVSAWTSWENSPEVTFHL
jgi:hypothetical protein